MNRRRFLAAAGAAAAVPGASAQQPASPRQKIYDHIDANLSAHIEAIQQYVRQPSISAENKGIQECAELTRKYLAAAGCREASLVTTSGNPGVWGYLDAKARKTLIVYWMYDVQPVTESEWITPPFEARLVNSPQWGPEGRIIRGRGAQNQKGPQRAFLNAVESIRAVTGTLPVNLMFACEGEEEMGSPHMPQIVEKYRARLASAQGVLFPTTSLGRNGTASFALGNKGIVYMELEAAGGPGGGPKGTEVHSSVKAALDSPAWQLVQALASMTDRSGNRIIIDGLLDRIRKPTARERQLFDIYVAGYNAEGAQRSFGVDRFADNVDAREALRRLWFDCSLNIDGIWGGYTGPGTKTILPAKANVKIDFRLVPDQTAAEVAQLVRRHLDANGFNEIKINWWNGYDPSQSDPDSELVRAGLDVCRSYNFGTEVTVRMQGSAPHNVFTRDLKLPLLQFGLGHGGGAHSKNEFLVVNATEPARGLAFLERSFVDLLYRFAEI